MEARRQGGMEAGRKRNSNYQLCLVIGLAFEEKKFNGTFFLAKYLRRLLNIHHIVDSLSGRYFGCSFSGSC